MTSSKSAELAYDMKKAALMDLRVKTLARFCREELIKVPSKNRTKAGYVSAILDHMALMEIRIELTKGMLAIDIKSAMSKWRK